ncbi:hypothetical protein FACS1894111_13270 [Clostridia bacterium]|nr:hypothetical protein FACS1894111_13270 [Clostridia bacterium]
MIVTDARLNVKSLAGCEYKCLLLQMILSSIKKGSVKISRLAEY